MEILITILLTVLIITGYYYRLKRIREARGSLNLQSGSTLRDRHVTCWYCGKSAIIQTAYPTAYRNCSDESCIKTRKEKRLKSLRQSIREGTLILQQMQEEDERRLGILSEWEKLATSMPSLAGTETYYGAAYGQPAGYRSIPSSGGTDLYYGNVLIMSIHRPHMTDYNWQPDEDQIDEDQIDEDEIVNILKEELAKYKSSKME